MIFYADSESDLKISPSHGKIRFFDKTGTPQYMVREGIEPIHEII